MAVFFKPQRRVNPQDKREAKFYPQAVVINNVDTDTVAREIAGLSSLSTGDVKNTIDNLVTVMNRHLCNSHSVTLNGFGTFRLSLRSPKNGVEKEEDVNTGKTKIYVRFVPAGTRNANRTIASRNLFAGVKCLRYGTTDKPASGGTVPGA